MKPIRLAARSCPGTSRRSSRRDADAGQVQRRDPRRPSSMLDAAGQVLELRRAAAGPRACVPACGTSSDGGDAEQRRERRGRRGRVLDQRRVGVDVAGLDAVRQHRAGRGRRWRRAARAAPPSVEPLAAGPRRRTPARRSPAAPTSRTPITANSSSASTVASRSRRRGSPSRGGRGGRGGVRPAGGAAAVGRGRARGAAPRAAAAAVRSVAAVAVRRPFRSAAAARAVRCRRRCRRRRRRPGRVGRPVPALRAGLVAPALVRRPAGAGAGPAWRCRPGGVAVRAPPRPAWRRGPARRRRPAAVEHLQRRAERVRRRAPGAAPGRSGRGRCARAGCSCARRRCPPSPATPRAVDGIRPAGSRRRPPRSGAPEPRRDGSPRRGWRGGSSGRGTATARPPAGRSLVMLGAPPAGCGTPMTWPSGSRMNAGESAGTRPSRRAAAARLPGDS